MVVELRDLRLDLTVLYDSLSFISRGRPTMFHETASENPLSWSYSTAVTLVAHRRAIQSHRREASNGICGEAPRLKQAPMDARAPGCHVPVEDKRQGLAKTPRRSARDRHQVAATHKGDANGRCDLLVRGHASELVPSSRTSHPT